MDFTISHQDMISMLMSVLCGGIIGFEREYRSKSAGFRTIILISLGSTIFTIVSGHGTEADDRIAANIITGIGFIGAGVIFKDQVSIRGLTTAAVIWTSAGIGMTTGIGYHALAFSFTLITLFILLMISRVEKIIATLRKQKSINVTFKNSDLDQIEHLENRLRSENLEIERLELSKHDDSIIVLWLVSGKKHSLNNLDSTLARIPEITSFN